MEYRLDKYGNRLSCLGYGCLRFPQMGGRIDMDATQKQIKLAVALGVNYFDTAYIYSGSEAALGKILEENGLRRQVKIATKLPHYLIRSMAGVEKLFAEELRRLRTDHVEYYLMHMLNDLDTWHRLETMGIRDWIEGKKASGAIGQIGFSYHGGTGMFKQILDAYDWDFCQIQYNYLDEHTQAGREGLEYARCKGIPVIIMEPLRGGRLVQKLPKAAKKLFADREPKRSPAHWGLRWLWDQEGIAVVLSGMNDQEMIRENVAAAEVSPLGCVTEEERLVYAQAVEAIRAGTKVGCTACGYCSDCPQKVDIPGVFAAYNRWYGEDKGAAFKEYLRCTTFRKNATAASNCIGCGKCEKHCPQGIPIRQELQAARKALETPLYRVISWGAKWFVKF